MDNRLSLGRNFISKVFQYSAFKYLIGFGNVMEIETWSINIPEFHLSISSRENFNFFL